MSYQPFNEIEFRQGFNVSQHALADGLANSLANGSANSLFLGQGYYRPMRGLESRGANTGSRLMMQVGKTWGNIKDIGETIATGSFFEDVGRSLWIIGSGQAALNGINISGATLSSILKVILAINGSYTDPQSGPFTAGLSQPSAPSVGISATGGNITRAVSAKIERRRPATGARSRASTTSAVVVPYGNKVRVTFPLASTGQTHWRVYFTMQGFGGVGVHYAVAYNGSLDIPESSVAVSTIDGIGRSIEIDFRDGDLYPEEASYDDFPPPAGTHAVRLGNAMHVLGCYADATTAPTSTNPGTAIAVSKPNSYESFIPSHLLFLPEQIVDVMSRATDNYAYVACQNSIHAIQYVGYRGDDLPSSIITTILPDIGIQNPNNWCQFRGRLALYTAEGNILMMDQNGEMDDEFSAPIQKFIKDWLPSETTVGYDSRTDCLILANNLIILCYCLKNGRWSAPIYLQDYGFSTNHKILSCTSAQRRLQISITDGSSQTAYTFDTGTSEIPISFVSAFQTNPTKSLAKNIYELAATVETDVSNSPFVVAIQNNLFPNSLRDCSTTASSTTITSLKAKFNSSWRGRKICLFGNNINGAGTKYLIATIQSIISPTQITIDIAPQVTLANLLAYIGQWIEAVTLKPRGGGQHLSNFFPNVTDSISYSVSAWFLGQESGEINSFILAGSTKPTSHILDFDYQATGEIIQP